MFMEKETPSIGSEPFRPLAGVWLYAIACQHPRDCLGILTGGDKREVVSASFRTKMGSEQVFSSVQQVL